MIVRDKANGACALDAISGPDAPPYVDYAPALKYSLVYAVWADFPARAGLETAEIQSGDDR